MGVEAVKAFFREHAPDIEVSEHEARTASVAEAAATIGVAPAQIAKTLAVRIGDDIVLIVARGDARLDNRKFKDVFGGKPRMLPAEEVAALTGHPVGGVCPFGVASPLPVYCDVSLQAFDEVFPAAGSVNSSVRLAPARLAALVRAQWVDLCQNAEAQAA